MRARSIGCAVCTGALALAAQGFWPVPATVSAQRPLLTCDVPFPTGSRAPEASRHECWLQKRVGSRPSRGRTPGLSPRARWSRCTALRWGAGGDAEAVLLGRERAGRGGTTVGSWQRLCAGGVRWSARPTASVAASVPAGDRLVSSFFGGRSGRVEWERGSRYDAQARRWVSRRWQASSRPTHLVCRRSCAPHRRLAARRRQAAVRRPEVRSGYTCPEFWPVWRGSLATRSTRRRPAPAFRRGVCRRRAAGASAIFDGDELNVEAQYLPGAGYVRRRRLAGRRLGPADAATGAGPGRDHARGARPPADSAAAGVSPTRQWSPRSAPGWRASSEKASCFAGGPPSELGRHEQRRVRPGVRSERRGSSAGDDAGGSAARPNCDSRRFRSRRAARTVESGYWNTWWEHAWEPNAAETDPHLPWARVFWHDGGGAPELESGGVLLGDDGTGRVPRRPGLRAQPRPAGGCSPRSRTGSPGGGPITASGTVPVACPKEDSEPRGFTSAPAGSPAPAFDVAVSVDFAPLIHEEAMAESYALREYRSSRPCSDWPEGADPAPVAGIDCGVDLPVSPARSRRLDAFRRQVATSAGTGRITSLLSRRRRVDDVALVGPAPRVGPRGRP